MTYQTRLRLGRLTQLAAALLIIGPGAAAAGSDEGSDPKVDDSKSLQALENLPPRPLNQRPAVTIYQFRSGVPSVQAIAATDMFVEALVKSRQFRVVERAQLQRDVIAEKQLNGGGLSTGTTAQHQLRGAQYIFDGTVSEAAPSTSQKQGGVNIGGLNLGAGHNKDALAVDVRILDADTGDVLDSVTVRKELNDSTAALSGTGSLIGTLAAMKGKMASPLAPDVNYQQGNNENVDRALRACINAAVLQLVRSVPLASDNAR